MLHTEHFAAFFKEVHGVDPFPWQRRLLARVAAQGHWPPTLDLPTGSGKTAAIDIAVFHLALQAARGSERQAPVRIAFVVDRRLVVDDAYARACKLRDALLSEAAGPVTQAVARALGMLGEDGLPLRVRRLRGGLPREADWARTPSQPTVLCSTVDQVGSRLLFRGYGVSDSMKPLHAGLIGSDCLILLDEAHLAEPFRQTLYQLERYRGSRWRTSPYAAPWGVTMLSATPAPLAGEATRPDTAFALDADDREHPVLMRRLQARKPARLRLEGGEALRRQAFIDEVQRSLAQGAKALGVVLNRVARARDLFAELQRSPVAAIADLMLLIGPVRPVEREDLARRLDPIRTGAERNLPRPLVVVATQCIEAGVDIDLDALFTEAAPIDALRQRFGRLNRDGRPDITADAAVVAAKEEVSARADDPVYGIAIREAWVDLNAAAAKAPVKSGKHGGSRAEPAVDFGIDHFSVPWRPEAQTRPADAPILMPAHLDLLSQTAPIPGADPEVSLHLHGPAAQPDAVNVVWRADVDAALPDDAAARLLTLMPPRAGESIALPVWAVRRWLQPGASHVEALADVPVATVKEERTAGAAPRGPVPMVFRWRGVNDEPQWIYGSQVRPGDTIVVPSTHGGVDQHGWDPASTVAAKDVADVAAEPMRGQHFAVRIAPGLLGDNVPPARLAEVLAAVRDERWDVIRDAVRALLASAEAAGEEAAQLTQALDKLQGARGMRGQPRVDVHFDVHGTTNNGDPRGVVFIAPRGLRDARDGTESDGADHTTEDDIGGSVTGFSLSLARHSSDVEGMAESFAHAAGLPPERVIDLKLAGWLHDQGKRDARFQRWMHHGDPLGADPDDESTVLAKSGRALPPSARDKAGLPPRWRHEALSVRLARRHERLRSATDADLVLWLIGTHHGHGRPLFPHADDAEPADDPGPQSLAFDWNGADWPALFETLKARYGVWELARMEAILRLADHRASEKTDGADEVEGAADIEEVRS